MDKKIRNIYEKQKEPPLNGSKHGIILVQFMMKHPSLIYATPTSFGVKQRDCFQPEYLNVTHLNLQKYLLKGRLPSTIKPTSKFVDKKPGLKY